MKNAIHMRSLLSFLIGLAFSVPSLACSCFGPQTFCGTLDPQPPEFPEPQWWVPDAIVLAVKVSEEAHGMDVRILETISGDPQPGEIIRVWGDCGLLCRHYPGSWADGDTVVWALKFTDLMGNGLCGTSLEQEGEYMISICGTYFLNYNNGTVTGPIADDVNELPYSALAQFISTCLAMEVPENLNELPIITRITGQWLIAGSEAFNGERIEHWLFDAHGKLITEGNSNGDQVIIPIADLATGIHLLRIKYGIRSRSIRVLIP